MDKQLLLKRYYSRLIALQRRSPLTAETYKIEIRKYLDWLEREKLIPAGEGAKAAALPDLTRYLGHRRSVDRLESPSVAKAISALRSFYRFLEEEGLKGSMGFALMLESPRRKDRLPEVHSKEDVDRLLEGIKTDTALGMRDRALYELIYSAGLRISEAASINADDLVFDRQLARVRGKGDKERLVVFGPPAAFWLSHYLKEGRPELLGLRQRKALFLNRSGNRLSRKGIWKNYYRLALEAGLSTKLHTLRHTFATELLAGGADLRSVQELLGHAEITTTQIYTHIDSGHLRDNHKRYLPNLKEWSAVNG